MASVDQGGDDNRALVLDSSRYRIICGLDGDIVIVVAKPGEDRLTTYIIDPDEAYDFASRILRAYDIATGLES